MSGLGPLDLLELQASVALLLDGGKATLERVEKLEARVNVTGETIVDVNRRLDLIEADVIDRAEENHKRITALVNTTGNSLEAIRERSAFVSGEVLKIEAKIDTLDNVDARINELAMAIERVADRLVEYFPSKRGRLKPGGLSVDRGEEAGS